MPALGALTDIYRVQTSAQDIIKRALRVIGALATGEPLEASQLEDGREALNDMLDVWNTESLIIWSLTRNEFTLTAGTNPHEIGPGVAPPGFDAPRPTGIHQGQAYLLRNEREEELRVSTQEEWSRYRHTDQSAIPCALYYDAAFPVGNLWFDVKPDAAHILVLYLEQMLHQISGVGTTTGLSLPPGYKDAIVFNLAIKLAPEYGRSASAEVVNGAVEGKASIKRRNIKPLLMDIDPVLSRQESFDIIRGQ